VAAQFKFVSYGGGANMLDYGSTPYFASYAHHVNSLDPIALTVGMIDPFQRSPLVQGVNALLFVAQGAFETLNATSFNLPKKLVLRWNKGSVATDILENPLNPHRGKIATVPDPWEISAWAQYHRVIWHAPPTPGFPLPDYHTFWKAYVCNVGTEDTAPGTSFPLPLYLMRLNEIHMVNLRETFGRLECWNP